VRSIRQEFLDQLVLLGAWLQHPGTQPLICPIPTRR
jgi:hypothetical protein